jgi:hypothetical protein
MTGSLDGFGGCGLRDDWEDGKGGGLGDSTAGGGDSAMGRGKGLARGEGDAGGGLGQAGRLASTLVQGSGPQSFVPLAELSR